MLNKALWVIPPFFLSSFSLFSGHPIAGDDERGWLRPGHVRPTAGGCHCWENGGAGSSQGQDESIQRVTGRGGRKEQESGWQTKLLK